MNNAKRIKLSHDTPKGRVEDGKSASREFLQLHDSLQDSRQTNPMKIKLVLERVFNFCSTESLRSCRLVSRQWRDESMMAWRDKAVLKCGPRPKNFIFKEYVQLLESSKDDDDDDAKLRDLKQYPFRRLSLFATDRLHEFSKVLTPRICDGVRYLKIRRYTQRPRILRQFLGKFPSLEILHFESCDVERLYVVNEGGGCKLPKLRRLKIINDVNTDRRFWEFVLQWCPNLEAFSFVYEDAEKDGSTEVVEHAESIFGTLRDVRESAENSMMHLKELELCVDAAIIRRIAEGDADSFGEMNYNFKTILRSIVESKFPLERLTINLGWEDIHRLLKSCKSTLKYLKTSFHCNLDRYTSPHGSGTNWKQIEIIKHAPAVPIRMRHLKEASLGSGHIRAFCLLAHLKLPSLEKLIIEKDESDMMADVGNVQVSFPEGRIYKRLETLEFQDNHKMPLPQTIESLAVMMPNLIHLTMPLDKTTFPIVCKKLNGLKTLNILIAQIRFEEMDDETLTGVSKGNGDGGPKRPNITNLKLLTDFKISCESQLLGNDVKFTDHSVIHGFLLLPHLYSLSIAFKDLSEDVKAKLLSHVKGTVCFQGRPPIHHHSVLAIRDGAGGENSMNEGSDDSESEEEEEEDNWHDGSSNSENEDGENEMGDDSSASESEDE